MPLGMTERSATKSEVGQRWAQGPAQWVPGSRQEGRVAQNILRINSLARVKGCARLRGMQQKASEFAGARCLSGHPPGTTFSSSRVQAFSGCHQRGAQVD